jgi:acyl-CoA reductase-like NAD-dependent aldehyde dehydrogenase
MQVINPATEEVIGDVATDTPETVHQKILQLKAGQNNWKKVSVEERLTCIVKYGELVQENKEELAAILTSETGKPIQQSTNEIKGAQDRVDHLRGAAKKWLQEELVLEHKDMKEFIIYEPLGVIANISAWNFPYNVGYNVFLYALVSGNAVCYKPSEYASLTGLKIRELLWKAGIPEDVFDCVIGRGEVGEFLLREDLDGYFFTGSYHTGKYIAEKVASKLVPVQLELGGKDPLYVMDDVSDVKQAAIEAAVGAFYNNGQSCCAIERIYVQEGIYDDFVAHFVAEVKSFSIGDPTEKETFVGPITRHRQMDILLNQVKDALEKGSTLHAGGKKIQRKGYYLEPTVLTGVNHDMLVMQEESFGPIIGIQKVSNDQEALTLMQDTSYGLTAAVFSSNYDRAQSIFGELNTGTVYWNCCDRVSPHVPWSGRKNSGLGSTLSAAGIRAFVQPKAYQVRKWKNP